jgi:hypothetical protein
MDKALQSAEVKRTSKDISFKHTIIASTLPSLVISFRKAYSSYIMIRLTNS